MNLSEINLKKKFFSVLKKKNIISIYIYNKNYYYYLKFSKILKIQLKTNDILTIINYKTIFKNNIDTYINQLYTNEFTKIKFTGKGYKIKKNSSKSLILIFNHSHPTILWWNNIIIKKLKKYKIFIKYNNFNKNIVQNILKLRYINIYTKKGLRESRQILLKKKGKK